MKKYLIIIIGAFLAFYLLGYFNAKKVVDDFYFHENKVSEQVKEGDIILQTSESYQCEAVRLATNSKFSHCGIIFKDNDKTYVLEAVQPVKITPLDEWISHGKESDYLIRRCKNSEELLDSKKIESMKTYGKNMLNKDYDLYFEWSDEKIYCSELVWKIYKEGAGIEICPFKKLKEFNLSNPKVKKIMKERYGNNVPLEENVIAPSQLAESKLLETVIDTYNN
ncbi:YiiX family permuted papain-like enzyme [Flavobacterium sp. H122]|uniref:YiiX family permuted papain-like enzyme n=1 Tax=Flavobacterium sp. H122 TaxID=2529860 RepID=UPI0010AAA460|nr:YiiX family permuted papain-like enzyme [Flavobacterium sp. H122]